MDINDKFSYGVVGCALLFFVYAFFYLIKPDIGIRKQDFEIKNIQKIDVLEAHSNKSKTVVESVNNKKIIGQIIISKKIRNLSTTHGISPYRILIFFKNGEKEEFYLTQNPH